MHISRRDVLRRMAGIATAASLWASTLFVLDEEIPTVVAGRQASNNRRNNGGTTPDRNRESTTTTVANENPAADSNTSTSSQPPDTTSGETTTPQPAESSTTGDSSTTSATEGSAATLEPAGASTEAVVLTGPLGEHTVPEGETHRLVGSVSFSGPLHVEGTLTCDTSGVDVDMRGNEIHTHGGGRIALEGQPKSGWVRWGGTVSGWRSGDRLMIAPTAKGKFVPIPGKWTGGWGSRPGDAGRVTLLDGRTIEAEVANLSRTVTIRNAARLMMKESDRAVQHRIRYVAFANCGANPLGFYPVHFHLNGDNTRGSLVEGVVVEGSANRAFVAHGSHGVTFRDCAAVNILRSPYWWDRGKDPNRSHDIQYLHCLALGVRPGPSEPREHVRLAGFAINATRNRVGGTRAVDCAAAGVRDAAAAAGFLWNQGESVEAWEFRGCVAHNNGQHGIFVWQNTSTRHAVDDTILYNNKAEAISHGAYLNPYRYRRMIIQGSAISVRQLANARPDGMLFEDLRCDGRLLIGEHNLPPHLATIHRRCTYTSVIINESPKSEAGSWSRFEDSKVKPESFEFQQFRPDTRIEIVEKGQLIHTWAGGKWS